MRHFIFTALQKKIFTNLFLIIASIIVALALAEGLAKVYGIFVYVRINPKWDEFRLSIPPPYRTDLYDINEIISQTKWSFQNGSASEDGTQIRYPEHRSKLFNIVDGIRFTTDVPPNLYEKIYIFGGSTIFSAEVPDTYTIPSYLQRLINTTSKDSYEVINMGMPAVTTTGQYNRLQDLHLHSKDIVVFYDGVNDALQSLYYGRTTGSLASKNLAQIKTLTLAQKSLLEFHAQWRNKSDFVKYLLDPHDFELPDHMKDKGRLLELLNAMKEHTNNQIEMSQKFATDKGARFVHVLQPHLFSDDIFTAYEKRLVAYALPGFKEALSLGYQGLEELIIEHRTQGVESYDLSDIFNIRHENEEYFLDFCHTAHAGNKVIASEIYRILNLSSK